MSTYDPTNNINWAFVESRLPEHMGTSMNVGPVLFDTEDEGILIKLYIPKKN